MLTTQPEKLMQAAEEKFGEVIDATAYPRGGYLLLIKRSDPAREDLPYMTIRGLISPADDKAQFHWGHYDMTREQAKRNYAERLTDGQRITKAAQGR